jgi:hypothetical protein
VAEVAEAAAEAATAPTASEPLLGAEVAKAAAAAAAGAASSSSPRSSRSTLPLSAFYREQLFNGSAFRTMPGGSEGEPVPDPAIPTFPASQLSALELQAMPSIQPYYVYLALRAIGVRKPLAAAAAVANVGLGFDAAMSYVLSSEKIRVAQASRPVFLGQMATPYVVPQAGVEYSATRKHRQPQ